MPNVEPTSASRRGIRFLAALPGMIAGLLPIGTCPLCWPAYAWVLSSLGLGFLLDRAYLLPVTVTVLVLALVTLGYRARSRRGYKPLVLGAFGSLAILLGRFTFGWDWAGYGGASVLFGAALWNVWPRKATEPGACPGCQKSGQELSQPGPEARR